MQVSPAKFVKKWKGEMNDGVFGKKDSPACEGPALRRRHEKPPETTPKQDKTKKQAGQLEKGGASCSREQSRQGE